jgi:hypothetical protein
VREGRARDDGDGRGRVVVEAHSGVEVISPGSHLEATIHER